MELLLRRATAADASALTSLAHAAKSRWGYPDAWLAAWDEALTLSADYVARHHVIAAETPTGALVGVYSLEDEGDRWSLGHLWVRPEVQGCGVGRSLMEHALAWAGRQRAGVLRVEADPHTNGFYERLGGVCVGAVAAPMPGEPERALPLFEFVVPPT